MIENPEPARLSTTNGVQMYQYKLRWAHFNTLDEYEDLRMCVQLTHSEWVADSHEDLVQQVEKVAEHKIKSICYVCSLDPVDESAPRPQPPKLTKLTDNEQCPIKLLKAASDSTTSSDTTQKQQ